MHILLVSDVYLPTVSGVATSTDSIARHVAGKGHHVTVVCPKPLIPYTPRLVPGMELLFTPGVTDSLVVNKSMTVFPLGFGVLWHAFRHQRIDVVHIQEPGSLGVTALFLAKLFRKPTVGAEHFSWSQIEKLAPPAIRWISVPFMKLYVRVLYAFYDAIMVPTKTAASELGLIMGGTHNIYPISNGVDTTEYIPRKGSYAALRRRYKLPDDRVIFLYIGRLDRDKNIETIIRAASGVITPIHLIIAGVGKQQEELLELSHSLGMKHITWIGEVHKQEIIDLYQLADAFVIMSPVETQSIVALQAISCGMPLIVANSGALPELVNGRNGRLINTYDVAGLINTLEYFATNPKELIKMGAESRTLSLAHHKPVVLTKLETLYKKLV